METCSECNTPLKEDDRLMCRQCWRDWHCNRCVFKECELELIPPHILEKVLHRMDWECWKYEWNYQKNCYEESEEE